MVCSESNPAVLFAVFLSNFWSFHIHFLTLPRFKTVVHERSGTSFAHVAFSSLIGPISSLSDNSVFSRTLISNWVIKKGYLSLHMLPITCMYVYINRCTHRFKEIFKHFCEIRNAKKTAPISLWCFKHQRNLFCFFSTVNLSENIFKIFNEIKTFV